MGETCILHPRLDSDMLMAAAIVHDCGRAREFTYGAEFGLSEEGRLLGHLAIGAQLVGAAAGVASGAAPACAVGVRALPPRARRRARLAVAAARGFPSAEALALYRLNALDASVKGALERGLRP